MAGVVTGTDETAQMPYWEWNNDYMSLRFVQRLPDQTRAFFTGRGFSRDDVKHIASHCVFQTVYRNTTGANNSRAIQHDINEWQYRYDGKSLRMIPREDWKPLWQKRDVKQPQIIAFEWSLFPSKQLFQAGDYNWGMSFFNVPHGEAFDLQIAWTVDGKPRSATIEGMTCAKDVNVAPQ